MTYHEITQMRREALALKEELAKVQDANKHLRYKLKKALQETSRMAMERDASITALKTQTEQAKENDALRERLAMDEAKRLDDDLERMSITIAGVREIQCPITDPPYLSQYRGKDVICMRAESRANKQSFIEFEPEDGSPAKQRKNAN